MKNLGLLLFALILLTSCKESPSGNTAIPEATSLEVRNNSGNVDFWFVDAISVGGLRLYNKFSSNYEIRHGDKGIFSFTKEDVGGDLDSLVVTVHIQAHNENVQTEKESITLDFKLGERRVVRIGCTRFTSNNERCVPSGLSLESVE